VADPRFYPSAGPVGLDALCAAIAVDTPAGAAGRLVHDVAPLESAGENQLAFCDDPRRADVLGRSAASYVLVSPGINVPDGMIGLVSKRPAAAFAQAAALLYPDAGHTGIAAGSAIDPAAEIHPMALVEACAVIGPGAIVGRRSVVGANSVIGRGVTIGEGCRIGPNCTVLYALLGDRVVLQPGVRIGGDGFGFVAGAAGHQKIPQLGRVIIQDDVEIGANACVDRGALGDTVVGIGTKIDNLVQIGHNDRIGRHCIIVSQAGLSGSVILEDFVVLGGQVGAADHVTVGRGARVAARGGITKSLDGGRDFGGFPAKPVG